MQLGHIGIWKTSKPKCVWPMSNCLGERVLCVCVCAAVMFYHFFWNAAAHLAAHIRTVFHYSAPLHAGLHLMNVATFFRQSLALGNEIPVRVMEAGQRAG